MLLVIDQGEERTQVIVPFLAENVPLQDSADGHESR